MTLKSTTKVWAIMAVAGAAAAMALSGCASAGAGAGVAGNQSPGGAGGPVDVTGGGPGRGPGDSGGAALSATGLPIATHPPTQASLNGEPAVTPVATNQPAPGVAPAGSGAGESGDAWAITDEIALAERPISPAPAPAATPSGPGLAAQLYGALLGTEIPGGEERSSFFTRNIRQVSFSHEGSDFDPQISRDGRTLVFSSTQHMPTADIYFKEVGSRVMTRLTDDPGQDVMPAISPDGRRLAFASNRNGSWDIWVMPIEGGQAIQVTSGPGHDLHPSWSPDGVSLVFCRLGQTSGRWELWVADAFDDAASQFIGYGLFPEWCPVPGTGSSGADQLLFQRSRERGDRTFAVWTMDFDRGTMRAGRQTLIASDPDHALINPSWSPDARRIAYSAVPNPQGWTGEGASALPPSAAVWMMSIDGRGEVPLTSGDSIDMMPTWSPRGELLFVSNRGGTENLWAIDMEPAILAATRDAAPGENGGQNGGGNGAFASGVATGAGTVAGAGSPQVPPVPTLPALFPSPTEFSGPFVIAPVDDN